MLVSALGVGWLVWSNERMKIEARASCEESVQAVDAAYTRAVDAHTRIVSAMNTFDESADLDEISKHLDDKVPRPKRVDCMVDPAAGVEVSEHARVRLVRLAEKYEGMLSSR